MYHGNTDSKCLSEPERAIQVADSDEESEHTNDNEVVITKMMSSKRMETQMLLPSSNNYDHLESNYFPCMPLFDNL